ncbi:MAG: hypothetical protein ACTSPV_05190 [Candidatus Hodarchaeales archaeon]
MKYVIQIGNRGSGEVLEFDFTLNPLKWLSILSYMFVGASEGSRWYQWTYFRIQRRR